ncbi:MAG: hypothetical protein WC958_01410 [Dehalococcoidales bacterium]
MQGHRLLLVGDNPFHGVSHLSQDKARTRSGDLDNPEYCTSLLKIAIENGADGFMFSVNGFTLKIVDIITKQGLHPALYAIAPAASDYVRLASQLGTPGMAIYLAKQILKSGNLKAIYYGFKGVLLQNPKALMKAYLYHEIFKIQTVLKSKHGPNCFLLHEIVTEMALSLKMGWLFQSFIKFMSGMGIQPGFITRNPVLLIQNLLELEIDLTQTVIVAPFNKAGFQMNPTREECEEILEKIPQTEVIAMSILAGGYLKPDEAIRYINEIPQIKGVVIGVSSVKHAADFKFFKEALSEK